MKQLIIIALLISSMALAQSKEGYDIIVNITKADSDKGKIMYALYASEATWLGNPEKGLIGTIKDRKSSVTFTNIPKGVYAISVYHDENDNGELDMNFLGIPKEDTGSSNNAPARFGPPKWKVAEFEVKDSTITQNIIL